MTRRNHHTKICGQRCQEEGQHLQRAWGRDEFGELCLTLQRKYSQSLWTKKADGKRDAKMVGRDHKERHVNQISALEDSDKKNWMIWLTFYKDHSGSSVEIRLQVKKE